MSESRVVYTDLKRAASITVWLVLCDDWITYAPMRLPGSNLRRKCWDKLRTGGIVSKEKKWVGLWKQLGLTTCSKAQ